MWSLLLFAPSFRLLPGSILAGSDHVESPSRRTIGLAEAVRAINNLATAQVRKDTLCVIDVKGLGRPTELIGKEEDFQQWSKKTEAFFAGDIKESGILLERSAEQVTEITWKHVELEFPTNTKNVERGVLDLEFCVAADAYKTYGSQEL